MNDIIQAISVVGFPAVSFLLCGLFLKYMFDKNDARQERDAERYDKLYNKISDLTGAVNHNSEVLADMVREVQHEKQRA